VKSRIGYAVGSMRNALLLGVFLAFGVGCSNSTSTGTCTSNGQPVVCRTFPLSFKTVNGITCTVSSETATPTCGQLPMPSPVCTSGTTACWVIAPAPATGVDGSVVVLDSLCADCCSGNNSSGSNCQPIACTTVNDCPEQGGSCTAGMCMP
jgi:hypothetical protein